MTHGELDAFRPTPPLLGAVAIDVRPKAAPHPGEAWNLPQVGEELLELFLDAIDVATLLHGALGYPRNLG